MSEIQSHKYVLLLSAKGTQLLSICFVVGVFVVKSIFGDIFGFSNKLSQSVYVATSFCSHSKLRDPVGCGSTVWTVEPWKSKLLNI